MFRLFLVVGLLLSAMPADAQRRRDDDRQPQSRAELEARFRERLRKVMKERVGLNDAQVERLAEINTRFEGRRRTLYMAERDVRVALRRELSSDSAASDSKVADLLDRAIKLQRDRLALFEEEQRELQAFMTPIQRARYWGLQEQLRHQMEEMRERRSNQRSRSSGDRR